jgi:uncharacterized protein
VRRYCMAVANIEISDDALAALCRRSRICELALFGSAIRDDFGPDSDVDVLVTFEADAHPTLFDLVGIQDELRELFGRDVDLLTRRGIERSRNPMRRDAILSSAEIVYAT